VIVGSKIGIGSMFGCALLPDRSGSIAVDLVAEGKENVEWVMRDMGEKSQGAGLNAGARDSEGARTGTRAVSTGGGGCDGCSDASEVGG
jgi:hypothetical protein